MSLDLPDALAPWAEALRGLDPAVVGTLVEPLRRLTRWIGAPSAPRPADHGVPDGFQGVGRGDWERLLLSEWAVGQVAPLEFLRRAAMGEQASLRLQRLDPSASRRCVVLLDAPPSQHGEPRLLHLALLVVLATRARRAGLPMVWGLLQGEHLADTLDAEALETWRHGARWGPGSPHDLARWQNHLELGRDDELWLIGGEELPPHSRRLVVTTPIGPDPLLRVQWGTRSLVLSPPPPGEGTRLFRRPPRAQAAHGRGPGIPLGPCWFGLSGDRLFVPTRDGQVIAYHVPASPAAAAKGAGRPRVLRGPQLLAAGYHARKLLSVRIDAGELVLLPGERRCPMPSHFVPPDTPTLARAFDKQVCMVDGLRQLWAFPSGRCLARDVVAFDRYSLIRQDDGPAVRRSWGMDSDTELPVAKILNAYASSHGLALQTTPTEWWLDAAMEVPAHEHVGGVLELGGRGLITFDGAWILWRRGTTIKRLVRVPDLAGLATHPSHAIVGWCTTAGQVAAHHVGEDAPLLRVDPGVEEA